MPIHRFGALFCAIAVLALVGCAGAPTGSVPATPACPTVVPGPNGSPSLVPGPCLPGATERPSPSQASATASSQDWHGDAEIDSSAVYPNNDTCRDGWKLAFSFAIDADGTVHGQGTADLMSPPVCPFMIGVDPGSLSWRHVDYDVLGHRSASEVELGFVLVTFEPAGTATMAGLASIFGVGPGSGRAAPVTIPLVGDRGQKEVTWRFESGSPPATYSASGTVTLTRRTGP